MSVRKAFSQLSCVSPTESALTLQTTQSMPPSSAAAPSTQPFNAVGSATSNPLPQALTPFAAKAFTTLATSSPLREQIATLAPSVAKSSAIARPMPLLPPVTSTFFPFSARSIAASVALHLGPVARAFERRGGAVDGRLVVILADQHQPDRQTLAHAAGNAHRGMAGRVERRGVRNHLERALDIELARRVGRRQRRRLHRQGRHQKQIVVGKRRVIGSAQLAVQVLRLGVEMTAIMLVEILPEHHRDLEAVGQF